MSELAAKDEPVTRRVLPRDEAVAYFKSMGEHYKAEIIASIPANEDVSLYREGKFEDLCRGPHVPSTGKLKFFKLMKVAGAYWRGDHRNEMLQRIYGTAWATKDELQQYLTMLEEAEKRDHRKLGRELDLFHIDDHAPGVVFWHPKGWTIWQGVEQYMRQVYRDNGYLEVKGPQLLDKTLWEKTGHWDKYRENMFVTESEKRDYALKPMNCPATSSSSSRASRATATCRCATASSASATATSPRVACTASCACAASPRTTGISSAPRTTSSANARPIRRCCRRSTRISASSTSSTRSRRGRTSASVPRKAGTRPSMR
jgi:threonyl-tRNA synthetase